MRRLINQPSRIIEIIGPAGVGKTTIAMSILSKEPRIILEAPPDIKSIQNIPFYLGNSLRLLPFLFHILREDKARITKDLLFTLAYLKGGVKRLNRFEKHQYGTILFDQGPIYMISYLSIFILPALLSEEHNNWLEPIYRRWANCLHTIVWLDASDRILLDRVRNRLKKHGSKFRTDSEAADFNKSYRDRFNEVISSLSRVNPQIRIVRIDTGNFTVPECAEHILMELKNGSNG